MIICIKLSANLRDHSIMRDSLRTTSRCFKNKNSCGILKIIYCDEVERFRLNLWQLKTCKECLYSINGAKILHNISTVYYTSADYLCVEF